VSAASRGRALEHEVRDLFRSAGWSVVKRKPSDWKTHYGSNERLLEDVKKFGANQFNRPILYLCTNKKIATNLELAEVINRKVIFSGGFYNDNIAGKYFRNDFM
jgi:hypothetical protein